MESINKTVMGESGFTLIELLTVVSIIGILGALAIPSFWVYKRSAAYSVTQATLKNARTSMEAGINNVENEPGSVPLYSQNSPGFITNPSASVLLPGMILPKDTLIHVSHDPTCTVAGCQADFLQVEHCQASKHSMWVRYGDGVSVLLEDIAGSSAVCN